MIRVTLCGSARFEKEFHEANLHLTLQGFVVMGLATYPSMHNNEREWYTSKEKTILDLVHLSKILHADCMVVVGAEYIGESTEREILWAKFHKIPVVRVYSDHPELNGTADWSVYARRIHGLVRQA